MSGTGQTAGTEAPRAYPASLLSWIGPLALAVGLTLLPLLASILLGEGPWLAHANSEVPVRIWGLETFSTIGVLGGSVTAIGHPYPGLLANPDPLGTLIYSALRQLLPQAPSYNVLVLGALAANAGAAFFLARDQIRDNLAATTAAVAFGTAPIVLSYGVTSAVTDVLHLWPFLLAFTFALRALRRPGWGNGLLAGLFGALGTFASTYNLMVHAIAIFPLLVGIPAAWSERLVAAADPKATASWRQWFRGLGAAAVVFTPLVGAHYAWVKLTMNEPSGHMAGEIVASVRHRPPFEELLPNADGYVSALSDYLGLFEPLLFHRGAGSVYFVVVAPGIAVLALAGLGLWAARKRPRMVWVWWAIATFAALASMGPFAPVTASSWLAWPANPCWLLTYYALPGGSMVLEPFRFAFLVAMALVVPVAWGARWLTRRFGRWLGLVLPVLVVASTTLLTPLAYPLPSSLLWASTTYLRLDEVLGSGAIVDLPYWDGESESFRRMHFVNQLVHGRPIMDDVAGFPARYLSDNPLVAAAVRAEGRRPGQEIWPKGDPRPGVRQLAVDGFAGVIVDPRAYQGAEELDRTLAVLSLLGEPLMLEEHLVFRVPGVKHPNPPADAELAAVPRHAERDEE